MARIILDDRGRLDVLNPEYISDARYADGKLREELTDAIMGRYGFTSDDIREARAEWLKEKNRTGELAPWEDDSDRSNHLA